MRALGFVMLGASGVGCAAPEGLEVSEAESRAACPGGAPGDVPYDLVGTDQSGDPFRLSDHCDDGVLILIDAAWSYTASRDIPAVEAAWQEYRDDGLMVALALVEGIEGEPADAAIALEVAEAYEVTFPVLPDPGWAWSEQFTPDTVGVFVHLAPGGVITAIEADLSSTKVEESLP